MEIWYLEKKVRLMIDNKWNIFDLRSSYYELFCSYYEFIVKLWDVSSFWNVKVVYLCICNVDIFVKKCYIVVELY